MEPEDERSAALRLLLGQTETLAQPSKAAAEGGSHPRAPDADEMRALDAALARASAAGAVDRELLRRVAALPPVRCRHPPNELIDVIAYETIGFTQAVSAARKALGLGVKEDAQRLGRRLVDRIARGAAAAVALEAERQDLLRLLGADRVRWFVIDTTGTALVSAWTTDAGGPLRRPTASSTLPGLAASEGRPVSLASTPSGFERTTWFAEEDWVPERAPGPADLGEGDPTARDALSWRLAVPLWRGTQLRGVLEFSGQRPDPVTSTDVSLASGLARVLGEVLGQ
jgi:GAF domain-containing protein